MATMTTVPTACSAMTVGDGETCTTNGTATIRGNFVKSLSAPATPYNAEKSNGNCCDAKRAASATATAARRVSFPAEELLVTGYVEPPNPWENAVNVTKLELMNAYVGACKRYDVAPLVKVTQQLQKIETFDERADCLDLEGEKLDGGQIEALEEVFKRVQFKTINLANTSLDDECSTALFDIIEYYESVERLNISRNKNISMRGWQNCCRMIKRTQCLHELTASGITVGDSIHILQRGLRGCPHLFTLHLENCNLAGRHFTVLMSALRCNSTLKELYLGENKLSSSDAIQVCNFLRVNSRLRLLNLANNQLEDKGVIQITEGLSCQSKNLDVVGGGLVDLNLFNNHFTFKSTPHLACALMDCQSLRVLDIGHNGINNEGIHCLKDALTRNRTLRQLGLKGCRITCEGAVALAEFIADSPTIEKLDLDDNGIRIGGLMALAHSMKVNQSVTKLGVEGCCPAKEAVPEVERRQHLELVAELAEYCDRNYEIREKRREDEEEEEPQTADEALSEPISRLLSLWANQPPAAGPATRRTPPPSTVAVPPPITISSVAEGPTDGWQAVRGMSHYSLRSPQPSPSSSPIPSPTRNRFRVTRVFQEADSARNAEDHRLKPSAPAPVVNGGGRFGRFKFTVTPVRTLDGVDTSLPPLAVPDEDGSGTDRSEDDGSPPPPPQTDSDSLDERGSPAEGGFDVDDSNDSVFLEAPEAASPSQRLRHDSMTFYKKKRDKEMRRSNSLPVELLGGVAVPSASNLTYNDDFASNFCYSIYGGGGRSGDRWPPECKRDDGDRGAMPLHSSPGVDSDDCERLSPFLLQKSLEEDINGNIKLILPVDVDDAAFVMRLDDPVLVPDGALSPSWDDGADSSLVTSDPAVPTTEDGDDGSSSGDRDSGIYLLDTSGDDLEVLHLDGENAKAAADDAAVGEHNSELIERLLSDAGGSVPELEDGAEEANVSRSEDAPLPPFVVESATAAVGPASDGLDVETAAAVCFSLVDVDDNYSDFVQQEYSRAWLLQTMSVAVDSVPPAPFCKTPSCNSLDLLTGDDDPAAASWDLPPNYGAEAAHSCDGFLCSAADLMSFGEQYDEVEVDRGTKDVPGTPTSDTVPESGVAVPSPLQRRASRLDEGSVDLDDGRATGRDHADMVSVWVNGHTPACEVAGDSTVRWMPPGTASAVQKNLETLVRHVALEGSESSSSSDSGVPESPISCSPPPLDVTRSPSYFQAKKNFCPAKSGSGRGLGFDLLSRLDLKGSVPPAQVLPSKGSRDVATEFLIPRDGAGGGIVETTQRETSAECPGSEMEMVSKCGLVEETST